MPNATRPDSLSPHLDTAGDGSWETNCSSSTRAKQSLASCGNGSPRKLAPKARRSVPFSDDCSVPTWSSSGAQHGKDRSVRAAIYARVSTLDQEPENQLRELRAYATARDWTAGEYIDHGVSGAKERRPALDRLLLDAKRRRFDVLVCWRLDRLGRNLRHLVTMLDDLQSLGVSFVSLGEAIDTTTPAGRLQLHVLGALAEFERGRIAERVKAGLARARAKGQRLGRPAHHISDDDLHRTASLSVRKAAQALGVPAAVLHRARLSRKLSEASVENPPVFAAGETVIGLSQNQVI